MKHEGAALLRRQLAQAARKASEELMLHQLLLRVAPSKRPFDEAAIVVEARMSFVAIAAHLLGELALKNAQQLAVQRAARAECRRLFDRGEQRLRDSVVGPCVVAQPLARDLQQRRPQCSELLAERVHRSKPTKNEYAFEMA